jgi:hypothetical protein
MQGAVNGMIGPLHWLVLRRPVRARPGPAEIKHMLIIGVKRNTRFPGALGRSGSCQVNSARPLKPTPRRRCQTASVPAQGGVAVRVFSNLEAMEGVIPEMVFEHLPAPATLQQGKKNV